MVRQVRRTWRRVAAFLAVGASVAGPAAIAQAAPDESGSTAAAESTAKPLPRRASGTPSPVDPPTRAARRDARSVVRPATARPSRTAPASLTPVRDAVEIPIPRTPEPNPASSAQPANSAVPEVAPVKPAALSAESPATISSPLARLLAGLVASWQSMVAAVGDLARSLFGSGGQAGSGTPVSVGISTGPRVLIATVASPNPAVVAEPGSAAGVSIFNRGETITVTLGFDETVVVQGQPTIGISVGDRTLAAEYLSGSGSDALVFGYTVGTGDVGAIALNGQIATSDWFWQRSAITDAAGTAAVPTYTPPDTAGYYALGASQWPTASQWQLLANELTGQLVHDPTPPWLALTPGQRAPANFNNPYFMSSFPGGSNLVGMQSAWISTPSEYAVEAATTADVAAAVAFARQYGLKVVIKGTGHDYFGRSTGPEKSLLIWTHNMQGVSIQEAFTPTGAPSGTATQQTITTRPGNFYVDLWNALADYNAVHPDNPRYVQGSASGTVGVGGWTLGGGLAQYSKLFGSGAANIVELEVVLADGRTVIANQYQNSDLFAAMRGGGGGTFGVMTSMTLATYLQPAYSGAVNGTVEALTDDGYKYFMKSFFEFLPNISNEHWGGGLAFLRNWQYQPKWTQPVEQVGGPNVAGITGASFYPFNYVNLTVDEAKAIWAPFIEKLQARPDLVVDISIPELQPFPYGLLTMTCPTPGFQCDPADPQRWWTDAVGPQASGYWEGWAARNVPFESLGPDLIDQLVNAIYANDRNTALFEIGKGLYGAAPDAAERQQQTAMNPSFLSSVGLMSFHNQQTDTFPGVPGHEPDYIRAQQNAATIYSAYGLLEQATPGGGSYFNQGNYFIDDWAQQYWGDNYPQLLQTKQKYDPGNFFTVHQGVGSDLPSAP